MNMTKEEKIARYRELNQKVIPGQIVCAGSSLMEMFPVEKFINEDQLDKNVDVCILDLKPSRLFINIGTNDLSDPAISMNQMIANYDRILSIVETKLPDTEIYMMAYYPINYEAATEEMKPCLRIRTNEKIAAANKAVEKLAEKHHAKYIDINDPLKDELGNLKAEYTVEGMHIKEEGYRIIFDLFMGYAKEPHWK